MPALHDAARSAAAAAFLVVVACNDPGPAPEFHDPAVIAQSASGMMNAASLPALLSFSQTAFPPILAALHAIPGDPVNGLLPPGVVGKTYTWNTTSHVYDVSLRAGAPANGVRFVLYTWNASGIAPVLPLVEIGAVDLIDAGTGTTPRLDVEVLQGQAVIADYAITGSLSAATTVAVAQGRINAPAPVAPGTAATVDFQLTLDGDLGLGTTDISYDLGSSDATHLLLEFVQTTSAEHTRLVAERDDTTIELEFGHSGNGSISLNGAVVATIDQLQIHAIPPSMLSPGDLFGYQILLAVLRNTQENVGPRLLRPFFMTF